MSERIVDACCLINLFASGEVGAIIAASGAGFYVTGQVRAEALSIRRVDPDDPASLLVEPIDLGEHIRTGLVRECRLDAPAESELFVRFAASLDDGEASCLAIAQSRGWTVATDDRKALRVAAAAGISVVTTPELLINWIKLESFAPQAVAEVVHRIERFARFRPHRTSPFFEWWREAGERPGS